VFWAKHVVGLWRWRQNWQWFRNLLRLSKLLQNNIKDNNMDEISHKTLPWEMWFSTLLMFHNAFVRHLNIIKELIEEMEKTNPVLAKLMEAMQVALLEEASQPAMITQAISFSLDENDAESLKKKHHEDHRLYLQGLIDNFTEIEATIKDMPKTEGDAFMKKFHMKAVNV